MFLCLSLRFYLQLCWLWRWSPPTWLKGKSERYAKKNQSIFCHWTLVRTYTDTNNIKIIRSFCICQYYNQFWQKWTNIDPLPQAWARQKSKENCSKTVLQISSTLGDPVTKVDLGPFWPKLVVKLINTKWPDDFYILCVSLSSNKCHMAKKTFVSLFIFQILPWIITTNMT